MATSGINLKPLLLGDAPAATVSQCSAAASSKAQRGLAAAPGLDWAGVATDLGEKIEEMFDLPLLGLMVGAWKDLRELADSADPDKHPPDESTTVSLFDHDLEASFAPHLDIAVSGLPALRVDFEIVAALELHGIELSVHAGAIRAVRLGSCQAAAKVKCAGAVIFERSSRKLAVPGEIVLPQAIPIGPPSAARA